tara:strand:- start:541 stop:1353 length:813 start_codon:yes stop_codon:yes gene_type:complete
MIKNIKSFLRDIKNYFFIIKNPFGRKIHASKKYYLDKFNEVKNRKYENIDNFKSVFKFPINKDWMDDLALHTQIVKKKSQINYQHGRILYSVLKEYINENQYKNIQVLEIGTARGFSSICMSRSIIDSNINGSIYTIDIIPNNLRFYWNCIDDHEAQKSRKELLSKWEKELQNIIFVTGPSRFVLKKLNLSRVNFAFIDGMHDSLNIKREFDFIKSKQKKNDIIIFDDVSESFPEVAKFINYLKSQNIYQIQILSSDQFRSYAICKKIND